MPNSRSSSDVAQMFNEISSAYDGVNRILSLGIDKSWRKKLKEYLPDRPDIHLLDLATGTCDQLLSLASLPNVAKVVGIDIAEEMLSIGQEKVNTSPHAEKISLLCASALEIPKPSESVDCVTISFGIRNVSEPLDCLKEMHRVLNEGGRALILEFSLPTNPLVRHAHLFYLRKWVPLVGGMVSGKKGAYRYLNKTIEAFPYGEKFCTLMREAGFAKVSALPLTGGIATLYCGEKG